MLLKHFKDEGAWKKFTLKNSSAPRTLAMLFVETNQHKNLEKLFLQTHEDQSFPLFVYCVSHILNEQGKLPKKWFKNPLAHSFSEKEVTYWCTETSHFLAFEKTCAFLDEVAPSWRTSDSFTQNMVAMFCRSPFPRLREFVSSHPEFFPQFKAFVEKINAKTIVIDEENLPEYFALKEKNNLLKKLNPQLKKSPKSSQRVL